MFVHIVKDLMRKLEAVENRLDVSLDRDEIQTLGLKLRFYFNETRHYKKLLDEVQQRIIEIQNKFGFVPEEFPEEEKPQETESAEPGPDPGVAGRVREKQENDLVGLVSDWLSGLEEKGVDPKQVLRSAGAPVKEPEGDDNRQQRTRTPSPQPPDPRQPPPAAAQTRPGEKPPPPAETQAAHRPPAEDGASGTDAPSPAMDRAGAASPDTAPPTPPPQEPAGDELQSPLARFSPPASAMNVSQLYRKSFGEEEAPAAHDAGDTARAPGGEDTAAPGSTDHFPADEDSPSTGETAGENPPAESQAPRPGGTDETDSEGAREGYWVRLPEPPQEEPEALSVAELVTGKRIKPPPRPDTGDTTAHAQPPDAGSQSPVNIDEDGTPIDFDFDPGGDDTDTRAYAPGSAQESGASVDSNTYQEQPADKPAAFMDGLLAWRDRLIARQEPEGFVISEMNKAFESRKNDIDHWINKISDEEGGRLLKDDRTGVLYFCAGFFAAKLGRIGVAVNWLEEARSLAPRIAECYILLGDLYFNKTFFGRALDSYREAEDKTGPSQKAGIGIVRCLGELGSHDELLRELAGREFEKKDIRYEALLLKAGALAETGRAAEAAGMLEGLMQTTESSRWRSEFAIKLAHIKKLSGDVEAAVSYYEKCIQLDPSAIRPRFELGSLYLEHNAIPLARDLLLNLIKKFPESDWADRARDSLFRKGVL